MPVYVIIFVMGRMGKKQADKLLSTIRSVVEWKGVHKSATMTR
jgi:hypothetical protein